MSVQSDIEYKAVMRRIKHLIDDKMYRDAGAAIKDVLKSRPKDQHALWTQIMILWLELRQTDAVNALRKYLRMFPNDGNAQLTYAEFLTMMGRFKEAVRHLKSLSRRYPGNLSVQRQLANTYEMQGENEEARLILEPFVEEGREDPEMARMYANFELQAKRFDRVVQLVDRHVNHPELPENHKAKLLYLKGRAHERLGNTKEAYQSYRDANHIEPADFSPDVQSERIDNIRHVFSHENMPNIQRSECESELPVFILSRPRSGSTLVERIIGSHPKAHAAGELRDLVNIVDDMSITVGSTLAYPECISDMDGHDMNLLAAKYLDAISVLEPGSLRVTNKELGSFNFVGLISILFPKARCIDLRRAPLDNCMACWMVDLGRSFQSSFRLDHLAYEYKFYCELMDHWHEVIDIPILKLNYEDLVADQEGWSRKIIDFLGLPWDDQCLRFYEAGKKHNPQMTAAPTLSYNQVTQPMYKTSVGRAEQFTDYLGSVRDILGIAAGENPLGHDLSI